MKKFQILFVVCLSLSTVLASSLTVLNAEAKQLNAERLAITKNPFVVYREKDHPTINVEKRNRKIFINRVFVSSSSPVVNMKNHKEWFSYCQQIEESKQRQDRLDQILARLKEIEREKQDLFKLK